LTTTISQLTS